MYLINLQGQGDTYICIVDKNTWDWIENGSERIPEYLKENFIEQQLHYGGSIEGIQDELLDLEEEFRDGNSGSIDNDRALFVSSCYKTFYSLKEAIDFIKENDIDIEDEYQGYIY